jgi:hypothetical protein
VQASIGDKGGVDLGTQLEQLISQLENIFRAGLRAHQNSFEKIMVLFMISLDRTNGSRFMAQNPSQY